jgi:hypothetical protein
MDRKDDVGIEFGPRAAEVAQLALCSAGGRGVKQQSERRTATLTCGAQTYVPTCDGRLSDFNVTPGS